MALADTARLIASLELQDKFSGPARTAEGSLDRLEGKTRTLGRVGGETSRGLGNLGRNVATLGVIAGGVVVAGLTASISAASNLEESMSKVNVVFGENADEVVRWASNSAGAFGQSKQAALEAAGTYGNLFQAFGLGRKEATEMSTTLVELAADLASFNNTSVDDALLALRSGLSGETEPLKRYGIAINDARLKTVALELGIYEGKGALTVAQKAQAAYTLILKDSTLAQGDFARTSGGLANQQRILKANLDNTAATIGTALLPTMGKLVEKFNDLLLNNQPAIDKFAAGLPAVFDKLIGVVEGLPWGSIGDAFRLMGTGAKAALDLFTSAPPWLQTAVLTGWGLNKLTGGALGNIVGALGSGLIKGILNMNAAVVNVNGRVVNGPGGPGGGAGRGGGKFPLLGVAGALGVAAIASGSDNTTAEMENKRLQLTKELNEGIITAAEASRLWADAYGKTTRNPFITGQGAQSRPGNVKDVAGADRTLLQNFGGKLDKLATTEVIQHLTRTTEIGLKGVGTSFQVGITTGMDPLGDIATRILARAEDPKAPPVMAEIQGHLAGLEEIQAQYLANGDVNLAAKVQRNIDTLHTLIGTTDKSNAIAERAKTEAASADARMIAAADRTKAEIASKGAQQLAKADAIAAAIAGTTGAVSRLKLDPKITVNNQVAVTNNVTISEIQRRITSQNIALGISSINGPVPT